MAVVALSGRYVVGSLWQWLLLVARRLLGNNNSLIGAKCSGVEGERGRL